MASFGALLGSSRNTNSGPIPLTFPSGWSVGPIFDWYNSLPDPRAKSIQALQIRKDVTGPVPHRFIVLRMCDDSVHRFDRRPDRGPDTDTNVVGLLSNRAVASQDSYVLGISLSEVERGSLCEIEIDLDGQVDLLAVVSVCYAISIDNFAREYTFLRHNCFFFSWTILMVISRHQLPYEVPQYDSVIRRITPRIDRLTSSLVDEAVALFLDLVIDTVIIFRNKASAELWKGMNTIGRIAWALPIGTLRFFWRRLFNLRLHLGLRHQLTKMVRAELLKRLGPLCQATLSTHMARERLDAHLWIEDTKNEVEEVLKVEIDKVLWEGILEAISSGFENTDPEQLAQQLTDRKFYLLGRNSAQFYDVWNAALQAGLSAVKKVAPTLANVQNDEAFRQAWFAARDPALHAAQTVVNNTSAKMNKPHREAMWISIWGIWNDCWKEAHDISRPRSIQVLEKIVREFLTIGSNTLIEEMREARNKTIEAHINKVLHAKERKWLLGHQHTPVSSVTNAKLQEYMQKIIQKDTVTAKALEAVHSSMERVWIEARKYLPVEATALDVVAKHMLEMQVGGVGG